MDYEATLAALLGYIGREVVVIFAGGSGQPPESLGAIRGTLERGASHSAYDRFVAKGAGEAIHFRVGEAGWFTISEPDFEYCERLDDTSLAINVGVGQIGVILDPGPSGS